MTPTIAHVSRRGFLGQVFSAGALVIAAPLLPKLKAAGTWQPSIYLGIEPDGTVKIVAHRSEMGTGCKTGLPMIVADELEADWARVEVIQAPGGKQYGNQDTDGSWSVRGFYDTMRTVGASARTMLENAAASKWGVPVGDCHGRNHFVVNAKTGRKLSYGELVPLVADAKAPAKDAIRYKTPDQFRYIGKDIPIVDLKPIITGKAVFGIDARMPGMVYAAIERPPVMGATLKSCDDTAAKQVKGVEQVVTLDLAKPPYMFKPLGGAAVIANNSWTALEARKKLKVEWDLGEHASYDSAAYKQQMLDTARQPGKVARNWAMWMRSSPRAARRSKHPITRPCWRTPPWSRSRRRGRIQERQSGDLDVHAESAGCAGLQWRGGGHQAGRCGMPRDAAGRRIRSQIEARLCRGSGAALEESRQAGEDRLEPRRRYPFRLLPFARRSVHEGRGG